MTPAGKQSTIVYLEPELRERLQVLADANGRTLSQEGRIAVREYLRAFNPADGERAGGIAPPPGS